MATVVEWEIKPENHSPGRDLRRRLDRAAKDFGAAFNLECTASHLLPFIIDHGIKAIANRATSHLQEVRLGNIIFRQDDYVVAEIQGRIRRLDLAKTQAAAAEKSYRHFIRAATKQQLRQLIGCSLICIPYHDHEIGTLPHQLWALHGPLPRDAAIKMWVGATDVDHKRAREEMDAERELAGKELRQRGVRL